MHVNAGGLYAPLAQGRDYYAADADLFPNGAVTEDHRASVRNIDRGEILAVEFRLGNDSARTTDSQAEPVEVAVGNGRQALGDTPGERIVAHPDSPEVRQTA